MKVVKTIDTRNGKIKIYDNDIYKLRKSFYSYNSLMFDREDLMYNLMDTGFIIKNIDLCLGDSKKGIVFYLDISMKYLK